MSKLRKYTKPILALAGLSIIILGSYIFMKNSGIGSGDHQVDFILPAGAGSSKVTQLLVDEKIIDDGFFFKVMLAVTGNRTSLKRGVYQLNDSMSPSEVISILTSGRSKDIKVVIPEGYNNRQIGDVLSKLGFYKNRAEFLKFASDPSILKKYDIPADTTEGYLFPSTYLIPIGYPKKKIISLMLDLFLKNASSLDNFPTDPKARHKLVILASIVEREAKLKEERPKIAGVFANRIKDNYPLESCATIQYLFEKPKKKLYYSDLEKDSPYNTYKYNGLPPGPIASPGLPALDAAVNPAPTPYRFFVVRADGSHVFSKTFAEHNKAKDKFMFK